MSLSTGRLTRIVAALGLVLSAVLLPAPAQAAPYCGLRWGSLPKTASTTVGVTDIGSLTDVRSGRHACYDRLVLDLDGRAQGYDVRYVDQVRADGSGFVVPTAGGARLAVVAKAPAHDDAGRATYVPADPARLADVRGYRTFRQVTWAGTFEGYTTVGVGVRARLPFRVFTLAARDGGSRTVVDVAHRW